jgi:DNA-binding transcriptional LysR family regulator
MAGTPRITLEQWRALQAVVEAGGYAQAAAQMHKSQSTLTYAVQKIQSLLGVQVFEIRGRKAVLTDAGQVLYRRARTLLEEAAMLERGAVAMAQDWQPEIRIAVDTIFPTWLLLEGLAEFAVERPETRIEAYETVRIGTSEMLAEGRAEIGIGTSMDGLTGTALGTIRVVAVASPDHPLHRLKRPITESDLKRHRRIFIRDTGAQRQAEVAGAELRWTVSHKSTSIKAVAMGLGFAWLPVEIIRPELLDGTLVPLKLHESAERVGELVLAYADREFPGRDVARLGEIIRRRTSQACTHGTKRPPKAR